MLWQYQHRQAEWEVNAGEETWDPAVGAPRWGLLPASYSHTSVRKVCSQLVCVILNLS